MSNDDDAPRTGVDPELARALMYLNQKIGEGLVRQTELASHVYALTEALVAQGLLPLEQFEERKSQTKERMLRRTLTVWEGAEVLNDPRDKYEVEGPPINCAERIHLCKAACCRLNVHLTKQDLHEGVVKWDVGNPYSIRQREDDWCTHCHPTTKRCQVHRKRPLACRLYDCREDARIWEDFEKAIPNPELTQLRVQ